MGLPPYQHVLLPLSCPVTLIRRLSAFRLFVCDRSRSAANLEGGAGAAFWRYQLTQGQSAQDRSGRRPLPILHAVTSRSSALQRVQVPPELGKGCLATASL